MRIAMRKLGSLAIFASLILAATGIGVWAASRTTHQAKVNVEDAREIAQWAACASCRWSIRGRTAACAQTVRKKV